MVDEVYPDMRMKDLFVYERVHDAMRRDASPTIRPMTLYVETPSQISSIFDTVAYSKCKIKFNLFHNLNF